MSEPVILEGVFVDLRPLVIKDAAITLAWRSSARARLLNQGASDVSAQEKWISGRPATERNWIIQLKEGRPVGTLSLVDIDTMNRHAEPGRFLIGEEEAVRGIPAAVEAMMLLYDYAFNELGMVRLYGTIAAENARMLKWQKYLGMREEGRMRNHYFINNRFQDALMLGLLDEEYRQESLPRMRALMGLARPPLQEGDA